MFNSEELIIVNDPICIRIITELMKYPKRSRTLRFNLSLDTSYTIHKRMVIMEELGMVMHTPCKNHKQAYMWELTPRGVRMFENFLK